MPGATAHLLTRPLAIGVMDSTDSTKLDKARDSEMVSYAHFDPCMRSVATADSIRMKDGKRKSELDD